MPSTTEDDTRDEDGSPDAQIEALRAALSDLEPVFERCFRGAEEVTDPKRGPLRDYYNVLKALLQHPSLPGQDRGALERKRGQTIRLIKYRSTVAPRFAARYAKVIRKGFSAVGLPVPDFASLSRAEALEHIEALNQRIRGPETLPADTAVLLPPLIEGLRELRSSVIPDAWV